MIQLRDYQQTLVEQTRAALRSGKRAPLIVAPTGAGKCLGRGTPVLMHDGTVRLVEDVRVGELLMGPDGGPRRVLSLATGREELFRVTPTKGDPYVVNRSHILSLRVTGNKGRTECAGRSYSPGEIANVTVSDYLGAPKTFRHCAKGWRTGVPFPSRATPDAVPPYILGLWLGDGTSSGTALTTRDPELAAEWNWHALRLGVDLREERQEGKCPMYHITTRKHGPGRGHRSNPFKAALHELGVLNNKHVPHIYKANSEGVRLEVLAGLMDSDGHRGDHGCFDYISVSEQLADDVCFLARSLGLAAYKKAAQKGCQTGVVGTYYRVCISGDIERIPCRLTRKQAPKRRQKKNVLNVGIEVESIGEGDYFGFEIDGDRLFLLGDFTVTHNTVLFCYIANGAQAKGRRVMILVHRSELMDQTSRALDAMGVPHGVIASGESMDQTQRVQLASIQTLARRLDRVVAPDILIVDECHHSAAKSWADVINAFPNAKVIGTSATPERLDGKGLGDIFDTLIRGPEVADLIDRGFLARPVYFVPPGIAAHEFHSRGGDFRREEVSAVMDRPKIIGDAAEHYAHICPGVPAIAFCASLQAAEHTAEAFRAAGFRADTIDGEMTKQSRRDRIASLGDGRLHVLVSVDLIGEGVDVPIVTAAILLRPTASLSLHLQQIGRVLRPVPGKERAIILDHCGNVLRHGLAEERREWSLSGYAEETEKKEKGAAGDRLMQCPKCFGVHLAGPTCTCCGYVYESQGRKIQQAAGELVQLGGDSLPTFGGAVSLSGKNFVQCPRPACRHVHAEGLDRCPKLSLIHI